MTNGDLLVLQKDLEKVKGVRGDKFTYAIARNLAKLNTWRRNLENKLPVVHEMTEYRTKVSKIENEYRKKIVNSKLTEKDQKDKTDKLENLRKEYSEFIKKSEEVEQQWYKLQFEEADLIIFHKIKLEDAEKTEPKLTVEQMEIILPFLWEEDEK